MHTKVIPDTKKVTLRGIVNETVERGSIVSTDEFISYKRLLQNGLWRRVASMQESNLRLF